ncbi:methyl-accepting chemotaxis protein [Leptospira sp. 2 VSF19]|uniref:Methyl-accepting chemotaxis protein n=1 Tax=Leptospira soteropolitanensis TaxID=2950025 RepID=A0AAW5VJD7_9LEPT|nr:methyl-accepting chemotaxis protein [Leptospira soteropolitanensis]MCW7492597.1 methyl-accepting chemotaxis protein [Leptospira soteropolitanensis]MCW7500280.1 methyl-accepting chemotaxis protein [Leptospira soteropolitanensis]MCW7522685.1 methyl-accepting chemotaxis protein [Leptospira soteropolitanensis]MCW7526541.1 methyl-accepting chemotaxis protein [Leptospira soteropolitanensis]MCW7530250.1 methyl-accepting chemotaxis protein [Leptospira soteropolitanensis]
MRNNKIKREIENEKYDIYPKIIRLEIYLVLILIVFSITIILQSGLITSPTSFSIIMSGGIVLLTVFSFFILYKKRKIIKTLVGSKSQTVDPVLLLSGCGIDINDFSDSLLQHCSSVKERMDTISGHILDLNDKIHTIGQDINNVYKIVSQLALEEVKLMDAVGKTSEEINIMFDIVNIVIAEIQSRNETMENLVFLSKDGRLKVEDTNKTIKKFSESSGSILKLIDLINGVSKETNLLAINAAIEATHSGTDGKGFTVIADEIGKLSTMTANNAKQITKILKENVSDYGKAEKLGSESSNAFQFIANEIHIVHGTIAEVIQSIQELKSRGGAILSKAKTLDDVAERVRDTSGEVYGEIITIHTNLEDIQTLSDTIQRESEEILDAQQEILQLSFSMKSKLGEISNDTDELLGLQRS